MVTHHLSRRSPNRQSRHVLFCIAVTSVRRALILIFAWTLTYEACFAGTPMHHELPMRAIVKGHNIQPRDDRLKALGYSDLTPQEAEEVDRLYRQLMQDKPVANRIAS
jgi:hypothetical protein